MQEFMRDVDAKLGAGDVGRDERKGGGIRVEASSSIGGAIEEPSELVQCYLCRTDVNELTVGAKAVKARVWSHVGAVIAVFDKGL